MSTKVSRLHVALKPHEDRLLTSLRVKLESTQNTRFSVSDIVRLALLQMARSLDLPTPE